MNIYDKKINEVCQDPKKHDIKFKLIDKKMNHKKGLNSSNKIICIINVDDYNRDPKLILNEITRIHNEQDKYNNKFETLQNRLLASQPILQPQLPEQLLKLNLSDYGIVQMDDIKIFEDGLGATTTLVVGRSKSGKSHLLMHIYEKYFSHLKDLISVLFAGNPHIDHYKGHKRLLIRDCSEGFTPVDGAIVESWQKINVQTKNHYKWLFIVDDCVSKQNKVLKNACLLYRNSLISSIISIQYIFLIAKENRNNVNSIMFFKFDDEEHIKEIIKCFFKSHFKKILGPKATLDDMVKLYKLATEKHGFIYWSPFEEKIEFIKLKK